MGCVSNGHETQKTRKVHCGGCNEHMCGKAAGGLKEGKGTETCLCR